LAKSEKGCPSVDSSQSRTPITRASVGWKICPEGRRIVHGDFKIDNMVSPSTRTDTRPLAKFPSSP
jgi:hypothetical protein